MQKIQATRSGLFTTTRYLPEAHLLSGAFFDTADFEPRSFPGRGREKARITLHGSARILANVRGTLGKAWRSCQVTRRPPERPVGLPEWPAEGRRTAMSWSNNCLSH